MLEEMSVAVDTQLEDGIPKTPEWQEAETTIPAKDVRALARGMLPADLKTRDEKPMAEYRFETSGGSPLHGGASPAGSVDDSAGFTGGPFNGVASDICNLLVSGNVPEPLQKTRQSGLSRRFEGEN